MSDSGARALAPTHQADYIIRAFSTLETLPRLVPTGAGWKALNLFAGLAPAGNLFLIICFENA
jgi:hypothetical protein